jgi:predicted nuclease of predicted toxin-antitoxin system
MAARQLFPRLNQHFDVKHIRDDLHHGGDPDPAVYALAVAQGRIIVTVNGQDFHELVGTQQDAGVIDLPEGWSRARVDTKLAALLMRHRPAYFAGRYHTLTTE